MHQDIYRKIVNAKYVLERAASIQAERNEMSQSVSVLLMHDAVELLMIAVLDHLNVVVPKKPEFMDFWGLVKQATQRDPPDKTAMRSLNTVRVGLKHNGVLPNLNEVRDLLTRARGFFENILRSYCNVSYAGVSLVDLVPDQDVRATLIEARRKFVSGDKDHAMVDLQLAFHKLQQPEGKTLPKLLAPNAPTLPSEVRRAGWGRYLDQLHSFLAINASVTNALMLGIDPYRYSDFVRSGPVLQWSVAGTYTVQFWKSYENVSLERFDELIAFLIDYALKVSEAYIPKIIQSPSGFLGHYERVG
ncbi:MAG: hypothetical protein ABSA85_11550 [Terracidiphilus sp.]|jgi:hypothetical protein